MGPTVVMLDEMVAVRCCVVVMLASRVVFPLAGAVVPDVVREVLLSGGVVIGPIPKVV